MEKNKELTLPSGAVLKITLAPFADGKDLQVALLQELSGISIDMTADVRAFYKDLFCVSFSSPKVEKALNKCLERATYNSKRIDAQTFEPIEAREDYMVVLWEVALHNILPFMKNLSLVLGPMSEMLSNTPKQ